jgi:hypothetical protein
MNYLKYIGYYFIQTLIAPINLIISLLGLSKYAIDLDLEWLAFISVLELKKATEKYHSIKDVKAREAEELANLAFKRADDPNG